MPDGPGEATGTAGPHATGPHGTGPHASGPSNADPSPDGERRSTGTDGIASAVPPPHAIQMPSPVEASDVDAVSRPSVRTAEPILAFSMATRSAALAAVAAAGVCPLRWRK